jgi:nickel-dependent lactate racemase
LKTFSLPYGLGQLTLHVPGGLPVEVVEPTEAAAAADPLAAVEAALATMVGGVRWESWRGARSVAIAINDETRPVPHKHLLPPLLRRLEALGVAPEAIQLLIATGTHPPLSQAEYARVVPAELLDRYPVLCHDPQDPANLGPLGATSRGTPIWINRHFLAADLRIVVGNVEPHQFQGFSGGVKSAAIGLAGHETIRQNHTLMTEPQARLGRYADNPARQDVEEIGRAIGVHLALNAVLNGRKQIVHAIAGEPQAVMEAAIPLSRQVSEVPVAAPFDLVIASPGGHPKDLNLYQSQKALAHASLVTRDGGSVILAAACPAGIGSRSYERWMAGMNSHQQVIERFEDEGFAIGPHKAYQIARDAIRLRVWLFSDLDPSRVRALLLVPVTSLAEAVAQVLPTLPPDARVGIMPQASVTIPTWGVDTSFTATEGLR